MIKKRCYFSYTINYLKAVEKTKNGFHTNSCVNRSEDGYCESKSGDDVEEEFIELFL
jgi:hypothetical protein